MRLISKIELDYLTLVSSFLTKWYTNWLIFQTKAHETYPELNGGQIIKRARVLSIQTITSIRLHFSLSLNRQFRQDILQGVKSAIGLRLVLLSQYFFLPVLLYKQRHQCIHQPKFHLHEVWPTEPQPWTFQPQHFEWQPKKHYFFILIWTLVTDRVTHLKSHQLIAS